MVGGKNIVLMRSKILPIAGDASFRKFYRHISNENSKIIVLATQEKYKNLIAYTSINKLLRKNNILAPKLYEHNFKEGKIVIQDFGNTSFYKVLNKSKNKFDIYKKLIILLIEIQKIKTKNQIKSVNSELHKINKYTNNFLHQESNLFFDWYLPLFLNKKKTLIIKKKAKKILSKLYKKLNFSNSCFVHRDFHAQNLMKVGSKIGVIDTQDAVFGNPAYDLVSLIDDVRIKTSQKLKDKIYRYYLEKNLKIYRNKSNQFLEDFNILSVQRNLKIIGIFCRLFKRDNKQQYLKFIPYTWKILDIRMKSETFSELKKLLDKNIPKKFKNKIIKK